MKIADPVYISGAPVYKYEMHLHTGEAGSCARVSAKDAVDAYYRAGYSGICVTNHLSHGHMAMFGRTSWADSVESWLSGYNNARSHSVRYDDFNVILGAELNLRDTIQDFLLYGITKEILSANPQILDFDLKELFIFAEQNDILVIQAHPFRGDVLADVGLIHGIEVFNGNIRHNSKNEMALETARDHSLIMVSGSDYHREEDLATSGMYSFSPVRNEAGLVSALRDHSMFVMH